MTSGAAIADLALKLPGGVLVDGTLERAALMRPVDGYLEAMLAEIAAGPVVGPERISQFLCTALDRIAGHRVQAGMVDSLCIGDRLYLMLRLACSIDGETLWLFPACTHCSAHFDIYLYRSELPVQQAGEGFPFVSVELRGREVVFRVPTGSDEKWIAACTEPVSERDLLRRCLVSTNSDKTASDLVDTLTPDEIEAVEAALDKIAPDVGTQLMATCPECGHQQVVDVDITALQRLNVDAVVDDVHTLASHYHWTEDDILALPRDRRLRYLSRIERSRGLYG